MSLKVAAGVLKSALLTELEENGCTLVVGGRQNMGHSNLLHRCIDGPLGDGLRNAFGWCGKGRRSEEEKSSRSKSEKS